MVAPNSRVRQLLDKHWEEIDKAVQKGLDSRDVAKPSEILPTANQKRSEATSLETYDTKALNLDELAKPPLEDLRTFAQTALSELTREVITTLAAAANASSTTYSAELDTQGLVHGQGLRRLLVLSGDVGVAEALKTQGRIDDYLVLNGFDIPGPQALYLRTVDGPYLELVDLELGWDPNSDGSVNLVVNGAALVQRTEPKDGIPRILRLD